MQFLKKNNTLIAKHNGETLRIEAWGENSLRVRAVMDPEMYDENWALSEPIKISRADVEITEEKHWVGNGSWDTVPIASITNGHLKAVVNFAGVITFYRDDKMILREYFRNYDGTLSKESRCLKFISREWKGVIADFYKGFAEELKIAEKEVERIEREVVLSDEVCEICGKPMAIKDGRFGQFLACTGYPDCKNTKPIVKSTGVACPKCGKDIIEKRGRKTGKVFYGCSGYPACDVSYWDKPTGRFCPDCGAMLVEGKGKTKPIKCSNPECKYKEKNDD